MTSFKTTSYHCTKYKISAQTIGSCHRDDSFYIKSSSSFLSAIGPVSTTSLPQEAKRTVNSLRAHGDGDCPDMGMSGLYLALLNSQPNSDVHYFSDAAAKDSNLTLSVISIAVQRQCRIILFISGHCNSRRRRRSLKEREVYKKLASATGGQLIELSKSNIHDAVKLVRRANISDGNSLLSQVSLLSVENMSKAYFLHGEFVRANRQKCRNASYLFAANFFASQF